MKFFFAAISTFILFNSAFAQSIEQRQFQLALSYEQRGDLESASRIYLELSKSNISNEEFLNSFVRVSKQLNKYQELLDFLKERSLLTPDFKTYNYLAEAYWLKGFPEESHMNFSKAQDLINSKEEYMFLAESLVRLKQYAKARDVLLNGRSKGRDIYLFSDELTKIYILIGDKKNGVLEILTHLKNTRNMATAQGRLYALMLDDQSKVELDKILNDKYSEDKNDTYVLFLYIWFARTAEYFQKALELTIVYDKLLKSNYSEVLRFANQCKNDGQYDIAIQGFLLVIEQGKNNPNSSSALYGLARSLEQKNLSSDTISKQNLEQIVNLYTRIVKDYPNTIQELEGIYRLAYIAAKNERDYPKSIELLKKISRKWGLIPVYIDSQFELSDQYVKVGKLEEAQNVLRSFIKSIPKNEADIQRSVIEKAKFRIARIHYFQGEIDSSKSVMDNIDAVPNSEVKNDILEFNAFLNKNQNINAALSLYSQAELLEFQERYEDAIQKFRESEKLSSGSNLEELAILSIAQIFFNKKDYASSQSEYESILDKFPNSIYLDLVYFRIGQNMALSGKIDDAMHTLTKIIVNFPKSIYYEDARILIRQLREKGKAS